MRIRVDQRVCEATGLCVATYPDSIDLNDDGVAEVFDEGFGEGWDDNDVVAATSICPYGALSAIAAQEAS